MSLKDNFNQAIREVLRKDGLVGDELSKDAKKKSELERYLEPQKPVQPEVSEPISKAEAELQSNLVNDAEEVSDFDDNISESYESNSASAASDYSESPYINPEQSVSKFGEPQPRTPSSSGTAAQSGVAMPEQDDVSPFTQFSQYSRQSGASGRGSTPPPPPPRTPRSASSFRGNEPDSPYYETEETTVISRNTIVDGNIRSFANINIDGSVKGDVKITKNISVTGKVVGDIECNNSTMAGASMQGNIASKGQVQIDRDSLLLGDISAQYLDLNGKVKGNVDVGGKAEFKTDAVILGNITASTITVLDGATIQGYVNTTFLQESSSSIFPEAIALSE